MMASTAIDYQDIKDNTLILLTVAGASSGEQHFLTQGRKGLCKVLRDRAIENFHAGYYQHFSPVMVEDLICDAHQERRATAELINQKSRYQAELIEQNTTDSLQEACGAENQIAHWVSSIAHLEEDMFDWRNVLKSHYALESVMADRVTCDDEIPADETPEELTHDRPTTYGEFLFHLVLGGSDDMNVRKTHAELLSVVK